MIWVSGVMNGRCRSGSGRAETMVSAERLRLVEADSGGVPWRRWGRTGTAGLLPLLFRGISGEGLRTRGRAAIKSAAAGQQMGAAR